MLTPSSYESKQTKLNNTLGGFRSFAIAIGLILSGCSTGNSSEIDTHNNIQELSSGTQLKTEVIYPGLATILNQQELDLNRYPLPEYNPLKLELRGPIKQLPTNDYSEKEIGANIHDLKQKFEETSNTQIGDIEIRLFHKDIIQIVIQE